MDRDDMDRDDNDQDENLKGNSNRINLDRSVSGQAISGQPHPYQDQAISGMTKGSQRGNVPLPNPFFTGRTQILKGLRAAFISNASNQERPLIMQAQVICGPDGIGKTQIAIEYAHRHGSDYKALLWVNSHSREAIMLDFTAIAGLLKLPEKDMQDQSLIVAAVKRWLEENRDWLLIFDNADQPDLIKEFLPDASKGHILHGHILLTSQAQGFDALSDALSDTLGNFLSGASGDAPVNALGDAPADAQGDVPGIVRSIQVEEMLPDEALQFLSIRTGKQTDADNAADAADDADDADGDDADDGDDGPDNSIAEKSAAIELAHELGCFPLALELAGAYIAAKEIDFQDYLASYRSQQGMQRGVQHSKQHGMQGGKQSNKQHGKEHSLNLREKSGPIEATAAAAGADDYLAPVIATWALSFQEVEKISEAAADLLRFSAFLGPDSVPVELPAKGASQLGPALAVALADTGKDTPIINNTLNSLEPLEPPKPLKTMKPMSSINLTSDALQPPKPMPGTNGAMDAPGLEGPSGGRPGLLEPLKLLARYSLISLDPDSNSYGIHRPIQSVLKRSMDKVTYRLWAERAILALDQAFPDIEFSYWSLCDRLLPHALAVAKIMENSSFEFHEAARLLNQAGYYLYKRVQYTGAEPLYKQALAIWESILGLNHYSKVKGPDSYDKLTVRCGDQEKYGETMPLAEGPLLTTGGKIFGPAHTGIGPLTAIPLTTASPTERPPTERPPTGFHPTAPCAPALQPTMPTLPDTPQSKGHPITAASFCNFEAIYDNFGLLHDIHDVRDVRDVRNKGVIEAELLGKLAPVAWQKIMNQDSLYVAQNLNNLAALYEDHARYAEAEPLYRAALSIREKVLGSDHPDVARNLDHLALLYYVQGDYVEAQMLYRKALATWEKALGPEHPDVAASLNNLALLCSSQGKYDEAAQLHHRALAIRKRALGPDHPDVATSLNNLVAIYNAQGKYAEAEPLYRSALTIREKALGPDHPSVAQSLYNLAELHRSQGKYAEAEPLHRRALTIREKTLGPDHLEVAASLNSLATLYHLQAKHAEAEKLYQRALAIWKKLLGPDHLNIAQGLSSLTAIYYGQGKYAEAEPLYRQALAIWEKILGPDHPDMATCLENYANLLRKTSKDNQDDKDSKEANEVKDAKEAEAAALEAKARAIRAANRHDQGHLRVV